MASELEHFDRRSQHLGQLMKLIPSARNPLVWSVPLTEPGFEGTGGSWSTPALDRGMLYVATNAGGLLGVDRRSGKVRWTMRLPGPTWASPVVVDDVLIEGDCTRHPPRARRVEAWRDSRASSGRSTRRCIESTPAVWNGRIYVGTRGGTMYALGPQSQT